MATGQKKKTKQTCLSEKNAPTVCFITYIECHFCTLIYLAFMEIVSQNNAYLLYYLPFIFLYPKNSKKTPPNQYFQFSVQFCCHKWTPFTKYFDTSFNLHVGQDFNTLLPERTAASHPNREKTTLLFLMLYLLKQTEKPWCSAFL